MKRVLYLGLLVFILLSWCNSAFCESIDSVALSEISHYTVDGTKPMVFADKANDLDGISHEDVIYPSDGGWTCAENFDIHGEYSTLTGVFFLGYISEYGNHPHASILGDGIVIFSKRIDPHGDLATEVVDIDLNITGVNTLTIKIEQASEHSALLSELKLGK